MTPDAAHGPLAVKRHSSIVEILKQEGVVRSVDLARRLGVAPVTIRRDITQLERDGLVERVHGGAVLPGGSDNGPVTGQTTTDQSIGMLVPSLDYYWPGVIRGAQRAAAAHGISLVLRGSSYRADDVRPQVERLLEHGPMAGLLLAPNMAADHTAEDLEWVAATRIPVVLIERTAAIGPMHTALESVTSDHAEGAAIALRHLVDLGHQHVGLLTSAASPHTEHIRSGWHQARSDIGMETGHSVDTDVPDPGEPSWDGIVDAVLDECLATGITALLVHADAAATALAQRCELRGISVPHDLSIIAYDDEVAELFTPRLTAVRPPRHSIGRAAVDLIVARIADKRRPRHRVIISPSLRIRETTVPPRAL
jgi:DNA-binding LacI/PurR family transcriptional regulator